MSTCQLQQFQSLSREQVFCEMKWFLIAHSRPQNAMERVFHSILLLGKFILSWNFCENCMESLEDWEKTEGGEWLMMSGSHPITVSVLWAQIYYTTRLYWSCRWAFAENMPITFTLVLVVELPGKGYPIGQDFGAKTWDQQLRPCGVIKWGSK